MDIYSLHNILNRILDWGDLNVQVMFTLQVKVPQIRLFVPYGIFKTSDSRK